MSGTSYINFKGSIRYSKITIIKLSNLHIQELHTLHRTVLIKEHQLDQLDALLFLGAEGGADLAARAGYPSITVPVGYAATGI